ncbi:hypothetical protein AMK18_23830 [Streptomyces sp. CB01249]|nr:hypothetical protein AMK18_23830 [Streptomyces sp. CB01249]
MELFHQRTPMVATSEVLRGPAVMTYEFVTNTTEMVEALSHRSGRVDAKADTFCLGQYFGIHAFPLHMAIPVTGVVDPGPERLGVCDVRGFTVVARAEEGKVADIVGTAE